MGIILAEFDAFQPQRKIGQVAIHQRRILASKQALNLLKKKAVPMDKFVETLKQLMQIVDIWWLYIARSGKHLNFDIRMFLGET